MKDYCIIIPSFFGIGGAQLYANRRAKYLIANGYTVHFYIAEIDLKYVQIDDQIKIYQNVYLNKPLFLVSSGVREHELDNFFSIFGFKQKLIIETFSWQTATWGEAYAQKTGCKHVIYSLGEPVLDQFRYTYVRNFFLFKYIRKELFGITEISLKIILGKYFDQKNNSFINISFDVNELVQSTDSDFLSHIRHDDFVVSTVSRLEKTYVKVLIESTIKFAERHPDQSITLLVCGDSLVPGLTSKELSSHYTKYDITSGNKLRIVFMGFCFPIGKDFYMKTNIFVGMGTAAVTAISQSCATICIDPRVDRSIGVFGIETNNFAYSSDGNYSEIYDSIEELYLNRKKLNQAKENGLILFNQEFDNRVCMSKIDDCINISSQKNMYYSFGFKDVLDLFYKILVSFTVRLSSFKLFVSMYNFLFSHKK